jgi:hypothetical protein
LTGNSHEKAGHLRIGSVAKFTSETECNRFVSAERAYSRAFGEIVLVWKDAKIKLRNRTVLPQQADGP